VVTDRRNRLMAIQKKISREKLRNWKGRTETALIEGPSKDNPLVWEARLQGMAPEIDGKLYLTDIELPDGRLADAGDAAHVEISKSDAYDLIGRVVDILPRGKHGGLKTALPRRRKANFPRAKNSIASQPERRCAFWDKIPA